MDARTELKATQRLTHALTGFALLLVVGMTLVTIPDAVSGVAPGGGPFGIASPVYTGAYMDAPAGHASGVGVNITFAGTNAFSIQPDNFLAAGLGVHSAGCCVDGIDYSYRFDAYLFHNGSVILVASGWEICDDNAACGGHSWKDLTYVYSHPLGPTVDDAVLRLWVTWSPSPLGYEVFWLYSLGTGPMTGLTKLVAPKAENPNFNTGVVSGGTLSSEQKGSYFFQFGVMSGYPIGHGGWSVILGCPAVEASNGTYCIQHARTLGGDQSYWKVIWRWGEPYPDVSVTSPAAHDIRFQYSPAGLRASFQPLW